MDDMKLKLVRLRIFKHSVETLMKDIYARDVVVIQSQEADELLIQALNVVGMYLEDAEDNVARYIIDEGGA